MANKHIKICPRALHNGKFGIKLLCICLWQWLINKLSFAFGVETMQQDSYEELLKRENYRNSLENICAIY